MHHDHNIVGLHGWKGFIFWGVSFAVSGVSWTIRYSVEQLDAGVVIFLHLLSGVSLLVGITVGIITIQDKLKARKEKTKDSKPS